MKASQLFLFYELRSVDLIKYLFRNRKLISALAWILVRYWNFTLATRYTYNLTMAIVNTYFGSCCYYIRLHGVRSHFHRNEWNIVRRQLCRPSGNQYEKAFVIHIKIMVWVEMSSRSECCYNIVVRRIVYIFRLFEILQDIISHTIFAAVFEQCDIPGFVYTYLKWKWFVCLCRVGTRTDALTNRHLFSNDE